MPGCVGLGVAIPLPTLGLAFVVVAVVAIGITVVGSASGMPKFRSTQYDWPVMMRQDPPRDGFCTMPLVSFQIKNRLPCLMTGDCQSS